MCVFQEEVVVGCGDIGRRMPEGVGIMGSGENEPLVKAMSGRICSREEFGDLCRGTGRYAGYRNQCGPVVSDYFIPDRFVCPECGGDL